MMVPSSPKPLPLHNLTVQSTAELALRFVLGKLGGFIQMMLEDNMEVPIGSVKEALLEAIADRESPEDTALIASIISHIAEVLRFDHPLSLELNRARLQALDPKESSPCAIPSKIREELNKAAKAETPAPLDVSYVIPASWYHQLHSQAYAVRSVR